MGRHRHRRDGTVRGSLAGQSRPSQRLHLLAGPGNSRPRQCPGLGHARRCHRSAWNPDRSHDRAPHELHSDVRRATVSDTAHHLYRAGAPLADDTFCCNGQSIPNHDAPTARMIDGTVLPTRKGTFWLIPNRGLLTVRRDENSRARKKPHFSERTREMGRPDLTTDVGHGSAYGVNLLIRVSQLPRDVRVLLKLPNGEASYWSRVQVCPMYSEAIQMELPSATAAP